MDGRAAKADGMMDGKGERASSWTNRSGLSSMLEIHPTLHHPCGCVFHPASIHPGTNPLSLSLSAPPCPQFWSFIMHPFLSFSSLSLSLFPALSLVTITLLYCCVCLCSVAASKLPIFLALWPRSPARKDQHFSRAHRHFTLQSIHLSSRRRTCQAPHGPDPLSA